MRREYGGSDTGYLEHFVAMEEFAGHRPRWSCRTARIPTCACNLRRNGNEANKRKYLPKLCSGEHLRRAGDERTGCRFRRDRSMVPRRTGGDRYLLTAARCGSPTVPAPTSWWSTPRHRLPDAGARGMTAFIVEKGIARVLQRAEARQAGHARFQHFRIGVRESAKSRRKTCSARSAREPGS